MKSKHFIIQEFVPQSIYRTYGDRSIMFIDPKIVAIADAYREFFESPITINNWHRGGSYKESGYRLPTTLTGGYYSQHKFGRAFDCRIAGYTPRQVYETIIRHYDYFRQFGLTTLENVSFTPSWVHSDCRWHDEDDLLIVNPI